MLPRPTTVVAPIARFLRTEAASGILLLAATAVALLWANLGLGSYSDAWTTSVGGETLRHWVDEGLMAVFFLVVGLEVKRELVDGELHDPRAAALPIVAAVAGMAAPALVYVAIAGGEHASGWAVPTATDIAFGVGVLAVLGSRVPSGLKLFLLTLAIVDDIGAVLVLALFYGGSIDLGWLAGSLAALATVGLLRATGVDRVVWYVAPALLAWWCLSHSGVHAALAGVALGLLAPVRPGSRVEASRLEDALHPLSAYVVLPVFALANAGLHLGGGRVGQALSDRVTWAVAVALVIGKPLGVAGGALLASRLRVGRLPEGVTAGAIVGVGLLAGIGFTVSLLVADAAFAGNAASDHAKLGVLAGSLLAGVGGAIVLAAVGRRRQASSKTRTLPV